MPSIDSIVEVAITVQDGGLTRQGFNSLLIAGGSGSFNSGATTPFNVGEVRRYTSLKQLANDQAILQDTTNSGAGTTGTGEVFKMASVAFQQQPSVPAVYVGYLTDQSSPTGADINTMRGSNDDWFGYVSEFNDAGDTAVQITSLGTDKVSFFLVETAVASLSGETLNFTSKYASLWHTKSASTLGGKYVNVGIASRILSLIPGSYTSAFKNLSGVDVSSYTATEELLLRPTGATVAHRINQYSPIGGKAVTWPGIVSDVGAVGYIDTYIGTSYLQARMTEDVFSIIQSVDKIPYSNAGVSMITAIMASRLQQSIREGFLLADPAPAVFAPDVVDITAADRSARILPDVEFTANVAGAVQTVKIQGTLII